MLKVNLPNLGRQRQTDLAIEARLDDTASSKVPVTQKQMVSSKKTIRYKSCVYFRNNPTGYIVATEMLKQLAF